MIYSNKIRQAHNLTEIVEILTGQYKGKKASIEGIYTGNLKIGKSYSYSLKLLEEEKVLDTLFKNNEILTV